MIETILIFGVPVVLVLAIVGTVELIKQIKQNYKTTKAIKELSNQDPLDVLFNKENIYENVDRQHFQEVLAREEAEHKNLGFFGKIKRVFSTEPKESKRLIKDIYKEKKHSIKTDGYHDGLGVLEKKLQQEHLSQAKSAYRILKSQNNREKYAKELSKKTSVVSSRNAENESSSEDTLNTTRNRRTTEYSFQVSTTRLQRFMMFFKGVNNKPYVPARMPEKIHTVENKG